MVKQFQNNVSQLKVRQMFSSTVHTIVKRQILTDLSSKDKATPTMHACDLHTLRHHSNKNRPDSVMDINELAQEHFHKSMSVNIVCSFVHKYWLKPHHAN